MFARHPSPPAALRNAFLPPDTRLNRYRVVRRIASGGFGVVYLGIRDDGRRVAIKEFLPQMLRCRAVGTQVAPESTLRFSAGLDAFFREADKLSQIRDPHVIAILDVFKANGTAYFAMPLETGCTLHALVRRRPLASEACIVGLIAQACEGVAALHASHLLHLDIKPGNLWLRPDGTVLVLDLGASRWVDEKAAQQARTPGFAPPEQHASAPLGPPADVYAMAATLRACLTGHSPPPATERGPAEKVSRAAAGLCHPALLALVDRAMALTPAQRPQQMLDFRAALGTLRHLSTDFVAPSARLRAA